MVKNELVKDVESLLRNEIDAINLNDAKYDFNSDNPVDRYVCNCTIRLQNAFYMLQDGKISLIDFNLAIRDFLLCIKNPMRINKELISSDAEKRFGLFYLPSIEKYRVRPAMPRFISENDNFSDFVEKAQINIYTQRPKKSEKYTLYTNGFIRKLTGFNEFKTYRQKLCVNGALNMPAGFTGLICMPTGGGKSLITQTVAYQESGLTIVVMPTVSLTMDQKRSAYTYLKNISEDEAMAYYSGSQNFNKIADAINQKKLRLLFISPEALIKNQNIVQLIAEANNKRYLRNIIIDEAHLVIEWGDYFRVDYQCLKPWRESLYKINPELRTFLLSATFDEYAVKTLKKMFTNNDKWLEIRCDALRKEPHFICIKNNTFLEKRSRILKMVDTLPHPMIVYVSSPYEADIWMKELLGSGYKNVRSFTGRTSSKDRQELIDDWVDNKFEIMIATSAFGVGVDKSDVRTIIHTYIPESPNTYYQELGRGGRDSLDCLSVMCVIPEEDKDNAWKHVPKVLTEKKLSGRWFSILNNPSVMQNKGELIVPTAIKPSYNIGNSDEYQGNETDEKWNINVLLMLGRAGLIDITGIQIDENGRYIISLRINDKRLLQENDESKNLLEQIRNEEAERAANAIDAIYNSIIHSESQCWSTMFAETYSRVSEYCAGCNYHADVIDVEPDRFPLVHELAKPEKTIPKKTLSRFGNRNEYLYIMKGQCSLEKLLNDLKPNIIVISKEFNDLDISHILPDQSELQIIDYKEVKDLGALMDQYFLSGVAAAVYYGDDTEREKEFDRMTKYFVNRNEYVIHITDRDFMIKSRNKLISECVNGEVTSR